MKQYLIKLINGETSTAWSKNTYKPGDCFGFAGIVIAVIN